MPGPMRRARHGPEGRYRLITPASRRDISVPSCTDVGESLLPPCLPVTLAPQSVPPGNDAYVHVIAGDILSPSQTLPVAERIYLWITGLPGES